MKTYLFQWNDGEIMSAKGETWRKAFINKGYRETDLEDVKWHEELPDDLVRAIRKTIKDLESKVSELREEVDWLRRQEYD